MNIQRLSPFLVACLLPLGCDSSAPSGTKPESSGSSTPSSTAVKTVTSAAAATPSVSASTAKPAPSSSAAAPVASTEPAPPPTVDNAPDPKSIARFLRGLGEPTEAPARTSARGPPYWQSRVLRRMSRGEHEGQAEARA